MGYKIDEQHKNNGYMSEVVNRIVHYAFDEQGLHRIEANIMPGNIPSIRVADKNGSLSINII